jgi:hypothetical protein
MKKLVIIVAALLLAGCEFTPDCYVMPDSYFASYTERLEVCLAATDSERFDHFVELARTVPGFDSTYVRPLNVRDLEESK